MPVIGGSSEALYGPYLYAGVPGAGTTAVQTITVDADHSTTFTITYDGYTTGTIYGDDTNATIQTAIRALPSINGANCTVTTNVNDRICTFAGVLVKKLVPAISVTKTSVGGTVSVANTTPGVTATHRLAPAGAICIDTTNGKAYENTSTTACAPTWTVIGSVT